MMILYVYLFVIAATFLSTIGDFSDMAITPRQIYDCTNINMFGCVLIFIFAFILNPLSYVAYFLYWIFHVGRKN